MADQHQSRDMELQDAFMRGQLGARIEFNGDLQNAQAELDRARCAIEFGEYMAKAAVSFMLAVDNEQVDITDEWRALNSAIYEFRKRAAKFQERLMDKTTNTLTNNEGIKVPRVGSQWVFPGGKVITVTDVRAGSNGSWQAWHDGRHTGIRRGEWSALGLKPCEETADAK